MIGRQNEEDQRFKVTLVTGKFMARLGFMVSPCLKRRNKKGNGKEGKEESKENIFFKGLI